DPPTHGILVGGLASNGDFQYQPAADFNGVDTFTYRADDGLDLSDIATVTLTVAPVNDPPSFGITAQHVSSEDAAGQVVPGFAFGITPGPADEAGQAVMFSIAGNTHPGLFATPPAIAPDGTLTYTAAADAIGTAQITVRLSDDGGTAGGGVDQSPEQSFDLVVDAVNDPPSFTLAFTQDTSDEDAGPQSVAGFATDILAGPSDEVSQAVSFSVTGNTDPSLFSSAPALAPDGTLTYTAAPDANGSARITVRLADDGGTAGGGIDQSPEQSFDLVIDAVNDAPSFTLAFTQDTSGEDAGPQSVAGFATDILAGPGNESSQTLSFAVTGNTDPSLFSVAPALALDGTLTYTAAPDTTGTAQITVRLSDDGGTAGGGVDQSSEQSFDLVIDAVNDAPSFTLAFTQDTSSEDAGPQSVAGFATDILAGPSDEASQTLSFSVTGNTDPSLFSSAPALAPDGTLTYTAAPDANGSASITVRLTDDGGTAGGGVDQSPEQSFDLVIDAVNDAPSFTLAFTQDASSEDAGPRSVVGFATAILAGPSDEASQTLSFAVTGNTDPSLFSVAPTLAPDGTLTYTAAPDTVGTAQITVRLSDDGGTANGGIDQSPQQSFDIVVDAVNDPPSFTLAFTQDTSGEDAGPQSVAGFAADILAGPDDEARQNVSFSVTGNTDPSLFSSAPALAPDGTLTYTAAPDANGSASITVRLTDDGGTAGGGIDQSPEQSFDLVIDAINDAPSFTLALAQTTSSEDAGPQSVVGFAADVLAGPSDEASQILSFWVTGNTDPSLFSAPPVLAADGTLTYTAVADAIGTAQITVRLSDDGGTAGGGIDQSPEQSFDIRVTTINDPPTFSLTPLASSLEDAGAQTVADFATSIRPGPDDEARQTVHFVVTELSNPALFETAPELSADGTLTYTSAPDANGTSTVSVVLRDDGGTAGGGMDQSAEQSFDIEITAVNDSPSFEVPEVLQVEPDSTPQIVIDFATELSAGPADEAGQALQFQILSNSNPGLFAADPELSPDGTLSFTLVPGASGDSAILEAILMDDGGTDLGGSDTSQTSDFTLVVPDAVAPQITSVSSPFGPLETCSESRQAFGRIGVDFSEAMAFAGDPSEPSSVLNPDNYQLIASGVDQDVTTTACGSLDGDDQRVFPSAVLPAATGANEVSVELPGVLRDGLYKLLVCDALADASGNPLAETFEVAFRVSGENGFANGQVDCDLEAWQIATGSVEGVEEVTYSEQDADDSSLSGSIGILSLQNADFALGQCVDWVSSAYDLAARVRVEGASDVEVEVVLHCERFSQSGCVGASLGDSSSQFSLSPTGGTWQPLEHASEGGQSALCGVDLRLLTGDGFEAFVDGLFVATQLFADGFESGNTGAWSNTVP
ncbi:MAG: Ig-like domain-containing protein, partial [Acidobacteriota bacterium]